MNDAVFAEGPGDLLTPTDLSKMSGLDFIGGIAAGRFPQPPICQAMNFRLTEALEGEVVFVGEATFDHFNPLGGVHGGWFGTLLDSCMACSVQTMLPAGRAYTTLEFKVNIVRPVSLETGPLRAEGRASHVGRRTGVAEGRLVDEAGKLYATGSTTCLIFEIG